EDAVPGVVHHHSRSRAGRRCIWVRRAGVHFHIPVSAALKSTAVNVVDAGEEVSYIAAAALRENAAWIVSWHKKITAGDRPHEVVGSRARYGISGNVPRR